MEVIRAENLSKTYRTHEKPEGFRNSVTDFFTGGMYIKRR